MTIISNVLSTLKKLKSSEDFAGAITALEAEHATALAAVAELEAGREAAIFSGGDLAALEVDIALAEGRVKTLAVAITGAERRRTEAAEAERQAELEAVAAGAGKKNKTKRARLIHLARVFEEAAGLAGEITELSVEIDKANNILREGGRGDLVVPDPVRGLVEVVDRQVSNPVRGLVIPEYWPHRHPDGPALSRLTK